VATVVGRVQPFDLLLRAQHAIGSPWLLAITYHSAASSARTARFDPGVVDTTAEEFERQVALFARHFDPIGVSELAAHIEHGARLPKAPLLITFDDGYLDNYEVVLPILQKYKVKGTFFIATDYIDSRQLFWWDKINYLLKTAKKDRITIRYPETVELELDAKGVAAAITKCLRIVKDVYDLDLVRFLDQLTELTASDLTPATERKFADELLMTWDQVRGLATAGMDVQSHTASHRVLQTLTPKVLEHELERSKTVLAERLGHRIHTVSYPVGKPLADVPHVKEAVRKAGYTLGFSNASGVSNRWSFDPIEVRRMAAHHGLNTDAFRGYMTVPPLAATSG
jgi:peptidoglycan/xylan/chitin deacetylase (PgdA/CDA1 family)